jgi:eukaryotic-like serine/threonine-protein kinase
MTAALAPDLVLAGRYRLRRPLASGGMGQVWLAADELLERSVAVKLLRAEHAEDPAFLDRFRAEARHAAGLSHPGVARVFDYGEAPLPGMAAPTGFLVMEPIDGRPLSAVLARDGRLPPDRALDVVAQAALALAAAHRVGVVHRDVKPGNLLVCADGTVKVTDFGIARALDEAQRTESGGLLGTAGYLSPEQAAGQPATPASDVYALGVVAYECLAGRRPFTANHPLAVALAHQREQPPPLPADVPAPVRALVERALAKAPGDRPPDGAAFAREALEVRAGLAADGWAGPGPDRAEPAPASAPRPAASPPRRPPGGDAAGVLAGLPLPARATRRARHATRRSGPAGRAVVALAVLVLAAVLAVLWILGGARTPAGEATVPSTAPGASSAPVPVLIDPARYLGLPATEVRAALARLGLHVTVVEERVAGRPGTVAGVDPSGLLHRGDRVTITVVAAPAAASAARPGGRPAHRADQGGTGGGGKANKDGKGKHRSGKGTGVRR